MSTMDEYERGKRDGIRYACNWLSHRAVSMTDPQAQMILNSAATNLGWDRAKLPKRLSTPSVAVTKSAAG